MTVTVAGPGRRERKKAATRQALRDSAFRLVAERGFGGVTIEDISEAADVAPRTFFNYFPSKEAVLLADMTEIGERWVADLAARPAGEGPLAALSAVLVGWSRDVDAARAEWSARMDLMRAEPHLRAASLAAWEEVQAGLCTVVARRTGTDGERDLYPSLLVASTLAALRAALLCWRRPGVRRPLPELTADALAALAAGLPAPRGGDRT
jgi:AcrR family transcriptional regulator